MADTIKTFGHTSADGVLYLNVHVGVPNAEVTVTVEVRPKKDLGEVDEKGWPIGYFEEFPGSMPELERAPQGEYEKRDPLE